MANQFDFKDDIVGNILFFTFRTVYPLVSQVLIAPQVILEVPFRNQFLAFKVIEGKQQVPHPKDGTKESDEVFLVVFAFNPRIRQRELLCQFIDHIYIALLILSVFRSIAVVIISELMQQDNTAGLSIAEQRNRSVHPFLQVSEADNVSKRLDGVQNTIGTAEGLNEAMHLQVFVYPESVQGGSIKAGEEHIHHDQQI